MSKPRHRGCRGLQLQVKQHDPVPAQVLRNADTSDAKLHANAMGCAGLIYLLATSYQPSVNGFYIEFLAITAEVFRPPSSGHCSRSHGPPYRSRSRSPIGTCSITRPPRRVSLSPRSPPSPSIITHHYTRHRTRGRDSHKPPLRCGRGPPAFGRILSRGLDKTPRGHSASPVATVIEGIAPSAPKG
jgi:hypothetical protein